MPIFFRSCCDSISLWLMRMLIAFFCAALMPFINASGESGCTKAHGEGRLSCGELVIFIKPNFIRITAGAGQLTVRIQPIIASYLNSLSGQDFGENWPQQYLTVDLEKKKISITQSDLTALEYTPPMGGMYALGSFNIGNQETSSPRRLSGDCLFVFERFSTESPKVKTEVPCIRKSDVNYFWNRKHNKSKEVRVEQTGDYVHINCSQGIKYIVKWDSEGNPLKWTRFWNYLRNIFNFDKSSWRKKVAQMWAKRICLLIRSDWIKGKGISYYL